MSEPLESEAPWKMKEQHNDNANPDVISSTSQAQTNRKAEGTDISEITSAEQIDSNMMILAHLMQLKPII